MTYTVEHRLKMRIINYLIKKKVFLYCFLIFITGFIISATSVYGACAAFGTAFVGALGAQVFGVCALLGTSIGYSFFYEFHDSGVYIASSFVVYTISFIFQYLPFYKNKLFAVVNVSIVLSVVSAFSAVTTVRGDLPYYIWCLGELLLCSGMTYAYKTVIDLAQERDITISIQSFVCVMICVSSFAAALMKIEIIENISFGGVLFLFVSLTAVNFLEPASSCLCSVIFGAVLSVTGQSTIEYYFLMQMYVIICVFWAYKSKIVSSVLLLAGFLICSLLGYDTVGSKIYEALIAVVLFLIIPYRFYNYINFFFMTDTSNTNNPIYKTEIDSVVELLNDIGSLLCMKKVESYAMNTMEVIEQSVERICFECDKCDICWNNHRDELTEMFIILENKADSRGKIHYDDLPAWFLEYCCDARRILAEINYDLRFRVESIVSESDRRKNCVLLCEIFNSVSTIINQTLNQPVIFNDGEVRINYLIRQFMNAIECNCSVSVYHFKNGRTQIELNGAHIDETLMNNGYLEDLSDLLGVRLRAVENTKKKESLLLFEAETFAVSVGVASKKKKGERVCGDSYSYFKTVQGHFFVILSDGLGAGAHASEQSELLIDILERFLINGLEAFEAVQLLNQIMSFRNMNDWDCATIDLFSLDLYSGKGELYKLGAAPSYLYSEGACQCIAGNTLSAGNFINGDSGVFQEIFRMKPGDKLLILSDGVTVRDDEILTNAIREESSMKLLARRVLIESQHNDHLDDDMTVIVVEMEYRA